MNLKFFYAKHLYLLQQKIDHLGERERILLLFFIIITLSLLWFFSITNPEIHSKNHTNKEIQALRDQTNVLTQKKDILDILIADPNIVRKIAYFQEIRGEMIKLDEKLGHYNAHYITAQDLAALLHDMLKQTMGVTIQNFATVSTSSVIPQNQQMQTAPPLATQTTVFPGIPTRQISSILLNLQAAHYRLVIRGTYFPVMSYLQHLEQLSWRLYWDRFDYTVAKYPEGIATIDFYTLKPKRTQLNINQGSIP